MTTLYTIGFAGKTLEEFIALLRGANVDRLIDVRLRPGSQLSGYARQADLRYVLEHYEGIEYCHVPELAPTPEILDDYRKTKDWDEYERRFGALMEQQEMAAMLARTIEGALAPAVLCSEAKPQKCHRRLIAEALVTAGPVAAVSHL